MKLGTLIEALKKADQNLVVELGFANPHSYRGWYEEVAFEPAENVTVASMLESAESAVGATFTAYKGGDYTMATDTFVHLAYWGTVGDDDGERLDSLVESILNSYKG